MYEVIIKGTVILAPYLFLKCFDLQPILENCLGGVLGHVPVVYKYVKVCHKQRIWTNSLMLLPKLYLIVYNIKHTAKYDSFCFPLISGSKNRRHHIWDANQFVMLKSKLALSVCQEQIHTEVVWSLFNEPYTIDLVICIRHDI